LALQQQDDEAHDFEVVDKEEDKPEWLELCLSDLL
jgi:hypothetical protein